MGAKFKRRLALAGAAIVLSSGAVRHAVAQDAIALPTLDVTASRLGGEIVGASTTVITAADIEKSPAQSLPDILGQATGVQVSHLTNSPIGVNATVDIRGFGAFAQSNVLVLVNGRRYQDFDLQGFDFASIPLNSIERVEITRGMSGTVLYGDGAIGGVINIVTKTGSGAFKGRFEALGGSYGYGELRGSAGGSSGPWSVSVAGNAATADGYRANSDVRQGNVVASLNYRVLGASAYLNIAADDQKQNLPGTLPNMVGAYPVTLSSPRSSVTPFDWAKKQDINVSGGFTQKLGFGGELIIDGGVRQKYQQGLFYNYFPAPAFVFDPSAAVPANYVDTRMTTLSFTPRLAWSHNMFGAPGKLLAGFDLYNTQYTSDREQDIGLPPIHTYDIRQTTAAIYAMNTTTVLPQLDVSIGGRLQRNMIEGSDAYNAAVDPNAGFYASNPHAPPVDRGEWQYAAHLGAEYRVLPALTLFGRAAHAFRLPNADERVGSGNPFGTLLPANLDLQTQKSSDIEGGFRARIDRFTFESTAYAMWLTNEIHFLPTLFANINLDPTKRLGWENSATYAVNNDVRLRGGVAYTRATFREGPNAGNDIPLVARWSGNAGVSWDIWRRLATLDVTLRYIGERRMDNDQANVQPQISATATVDVKLGGEYRNLFWSVAALNLFDKHYYDYAIASAFVVGAFNAYPQAGRTFLLRAGANF